MKFGDELRRQAIPEWKTKYLDYDRLKNVVEVNKEAANVQQTDKVREDVAIGFWGVLELELEVVDTFAALQARRSQIKNQNAQHLG